VTLPAFLADTLARWGAMMQRPLHEPVPVAAAPSSEWAWGVPGAFENRTEWLAEFDARNAIAREENHARATVALLPSTGYRTNPRPMQVPVVARCYY
jgi:hypothetical protein